MTDNQLTKTKSIFEGIAGEEGKVEYIKGTVYYFGSELATLRLWKEYIGSGDKAKASFSKNLNCFFFRLETNI